MLIAMAALTPSRLAAQSATANNQGLLRPPVGGELRALPALGTTAPADATALPPEQLPSFDDQPGAGAGTTGFDSTYVLRKKRLNGVPAKTSVTPSISEARLPQNQNQTRAGLSPIKATGGAIAAPGAAALASAPVPLAPPPLAPSAAAVADASIPRTLIRTPAADDKPFDPVGIEAGAFLLRPALEVSGGYDTNPGRTTAGGGASVFATVAPELQVNSNWLRHELTASLRGSYLSYGADSQLDQPNFDGKVDGRIDVSSHTQINLESRLLLSTDNPGSPNIQTGLARLPIYTDVGGSLGLAQRFNRFDVLLKGSFDRTTYQDSVFTDGASASNDDRNFDQPSAQLRANYELTPGIRPFVEFDLDRRLHDLTVDRSGFERDSDGFAGKLGSSFELSRILIGELALGYLDRTYKDPNLPDVRGPTLDGSLTWLATALTTVKFTAATIASETTLPGVSGEFTHELGFEVDHDFRRWLSLALKLTGDRDVYVGSPRMDYRYVTAADLTYKLTREMWLKGELRREWLNSNFPGNDYQAYVALLGLRLQR
jgi:hypothetical protein